MKIGFLQAIVLSLLVVGCTGEGDSTDSTLNNSTTSEEVNNANEDGTDILNQDEETIEDNRDCIVHLSAFILDPDQDPTNVRKSPGGDVIATLAPDTEHEVELEGLKDGWFMVTEIFSFDDEEEVDLPEGKGWIHWSVIALSTRNYGGQKLSLRAADNIDADIVYSFSEEKLVRPLDVCGDWVQVEITQGSKSYKGWIEQEWLCGSAVTTCS